MLSTWTKYLRTFKFNLRWLKARIVLGLSVGRLGERQAARHLKRLGYKVITSNWRYGRKEIDLIAQQGTCAIFIEVKTRHCNFSQIFPPEQAVDLRKQYTIRTLANRYVEQRKKSFSPFPRSQRFDVITVTYEQRAWFWLKNCRICHLKDAF